MKVEFRVIPDETSNHDHLLMRVNSEIIGYWHFWKNSLKNMFFPGFYWLEKPEIDWEENIYGYSLPSTFRFFGEKNEPETSPIT